MEAANKISLKQKFINYKNHPGSLIMLLITWLAALLTAAVVVFLVAYILIKGVPNIKPSLFAWKYNSENVSMMPAIINTVIMTALSLLLAAPIGIFSAVYLTEYAKRGNTLVSVVRVTTEALAGIPSIVYGLFGYLIFVIACHFHQSMLSGALTLAIMILPTMMRTTEEALLGVPDAYREGSFGLGAGRLRTVFKVVSVGRIVGETAALIYTSGTVAGIPKDLMQSGRTLSVHMYALLSEGLYMNEAYATAVVLLILVLIINMLSGLIAKRITAKGK